MTYHCATVIVLRTRQPGKTEAVISRLSTVSMCCHSTSFPCSQTTTTAASHCLHTDPRRQSVCTPYVCHCSFLSTYLYIATFLYTLFFEVINDFILFIFVDKISK